MFLLAPVYTGTAAQDIVARSAVQDICTVQSVDGVITCQPMYDTFYGDESNNFNGKLIYFLGSPDLNQLSFGIYI